MKTLNDIIWSEDNLNEVEEGLLLREGKEGRYIQEMIMCCSAPGGTVCPPEVNMGEIHR